MKWKNKIDTFTEKQRHWRGKYLETCEVLNEEHEVNIYSCDDINNYEIYVNYGKMYGIIYVPQSKAQSLKEEIKQVLFDDYMSHNQYKGMDRDDYPNSKFINDFQKRFGLDIPLDMFFDSNALMDSMIDAFDNFDSLNNEHDYEDEDE